MISTERLNEIERDLEAVRGLEDSVNPKQWIATCRELLSALRAPLPIHDASEKPEHESVVIAFAEYGIELGVYLKTGALGATDILSNDQGYQPFASFTRWVYENDLVDYFNSRQQQQTKKAGATA